MSEDECILSFPIDNEGYFRRSCPLCKREFKVLLRDDELKSLAQKGIDTFMLERDGDNQDSEECEESGNEYTCPYCGQLAHENSWWTLEQIEFINGIIRNMLAQMINDNLIRPLERLSRKSEGSLFSMSFQGEEMGQENTWMAPEVNDLEVFDLPCCQRRIKIDSVQIPVVHCYYCGFTHAKA